MADISHISEKACKKGKQKTRPGEQLCFCCFSPHSHVTDSKQMQTAAKTELIIQPQWTKLAFYFWVLRSKSRSLYMLGKYATTELNLQPPTSVDQVQVIWNMPFFLLLVFSSAISVLIVKHRRLCTRHSAATDVWTLLDQRKQGLARW